jgi:cytochrome b561
MIPAMRPRYSAGLRRIHWLTAVLVAAAYLMIEQRGVFPRGSSGRTFMMQGHFWAGLTVFAFAMWRIALRLRHGAPPITPALPAWQGWLSRLLHLSLYAFVVVMPLLGLATAWTDGKSVLLPFTGIALPPLLPVDKPLAHQLEDLHGNIGEVFYWIIGLHIVAGLYHHAWRRDDTLRRML